MRDRAEAVSQNWIRTVFIVSLGSHERGDKYAHQSHVGDRVDAVALVLVEGVHGTWTQAMDFIRHQIGERALALDYQVRLHVILVLHGL